MANLNRPTEPLWIPHPSHTSRAEFSHDGRFLLTTCESAASGSYARLWNSTTGASESDWIQHSDEPNLVAIGFCPSNDRFLTAGDDGRLLVHRIENALGSNGNAAVELDLECSIRSRVSDAIWTHDGSSIVVAGTNKSLHVLCSETGAARFPKLKLTRAPRSPYSRAMQISPSGKWLAVFAGVNVTVIDLSQGSLAARFAHRLGVSAMSWRNDGQLITACDDYAIREWNVADTERIRTICQMPRWIWTLQCSCDGQTLLVGTEDEMPGPLAGNGHAEIVDLSTGQRLSPLMCHEGTVLATFNFDESRIATGSSDTTIAIWDPASGECLSRYPHESMVVGVRFSPDGTRIASVGGQHIKVWNVP